jgi:hypothetical protein
MFKQIPFDSNFWKEVEINFPEAAPAWDEVNGSFWLEKAIEFTKDCKPRVYIYDNTILIVLGDHRDINRSLFVVSYNNLGKVWDFGNRIDW